MRSLLERRRALGLRQRDLAAAAAVSPGVLCHLERGSRMHCGPRALALVEAALTRLERGTKKEHTMATHLHLVEDADKEILATIERLLRQIEPILAGNEPAVQGVVLTDLLATWIEGHVIPGNQAETDQRRAELLSHHIRTVTAMVPLGIWSFGIEREPF